MVHDSTSYTVLSVYGAASYSIIMIHDAASYTVLRVYGAASYSVIMVHDIASYTVFKGIWRFVIFRYGTTIAAFNKKKALFTSTLDLELRKKLVKCYIWSIALYGAETWTLRAVDQKHLESFEMWCWRRMENISWTDHVRNEEVLKSTSRRTSYMK